HKPGRAHHIAAHAVAEEHVVMTAFLCAEIGIEGENCEHASCGGAKVLGYQLGRLVGNPAEVLVNLLTGYQDQLLRLLVIVIGDVREQLTYNIEVDILPTGIRIWYRTW